MKKTLEKLPSWDLSDLFSSEKDPKIEKTFVSLLRQANRFAKTYRGKIRKTLSPKSLLGIMKEYEAIIQELSKPETYAYLRFSADASNPSSGAFLQKMQTESLTVTRVLTFFELELLALPESLLKRFVKSSELVRYRHFLKRLLRSKPHRLSEAEEQLMEDLSLTGRSAFIRMYDEEHATKTYEARSEKARGEMNEQQILELLHHPSRRIRKQAAETFTQGLTQDARRFAYITNILVQDKATKDRIVKFSSPEESRHESNDITQATVDALSTTVAKSYDVVQDFYRFKKKHLRLDRLYEYDRYAPFSKTKTLYSYPEAKRIILDAFSRLSPKMAETAETFFTNGWIDAAVRPGKRGGAFCMYVTPDLHPYVFVNYGGGANDVMTLAHELGHAVHASVARPCGYFSMHSPLTLAETASVFGEMLVFDALKKTLPPKERLALVAQKVESIFATVHRQISMYRFEQLVHHEIREHGEQNAEQIGALWRKTQSEMFGNSVTLTEGYNSWWSYITHFIHSPFYVYAYAFGELLTLSLFAQWKKGDKKFSEKYLDLLSKGGSASPDELLRPFGIDLTDPMFWAQGIKLINELVEEAKALSKN
jgi:oligoendopeptidase F